jgi:hypothetical protein
MRDLEILRDSVSARKNMTNAVQGKVEIADSMG